jgi:hypothetical protein
MLAYAYCISTVMVVGPPGHPLRARLCECDQKRWDHAIDYYQKTGKGQCWRELNVNAATMLFVRITRLEELATERELTTVERTELTRLKAIPPEEIRRLHNSDVSEPI